MGLFVTCMERHVGGIGAADSRGSRPDFTELSSLCWEHRCKKMHYGEVGFIDCIYTRNTCT